MSYLNLPSIDLADFSKGTISLWFRFSQDAVAAASAYSASYNGPLPEAAPSAPEIFNGTIPLVTFGRKVMAECYGSTRQTFSQVAIDGTVLTTSVPKLTFLGQSPCEPSHIGLKVTGSDVNLIMAFQTEGRATAQGLNHETTNIYWVLPEGQAVYQQYTTVRDISFIQTGQPGSFLIKSAFTVAPDRWHHLLVSFDFSTSIDVLAAAVPDTGAYDEASELAATIKSYCKLWYAFDDVNKNGKDNIGEGWVPQSDNGIVTQNAKSAAFVYRASAPDPFVTGGTENPEYHWATSPIPMNGGSVGLPASSEYVNTIYHCEMAEFQMFTGVTLDTGTTGNRRAFVDGTGKPVDPAQAATLLGKPAIMLHKTTNWQNGYNTGTSGIETSSDGEVNKLPHGQFTPIARIAKYTPDPVLG